PARPLHVHAIHLIRRSQADRDRELALAQIAARTGDNARQLPAASLRQGPLSTDAPDRAPLPTDLDRKSLPTALRLPTGFLRLTRCRRALDYLRLRASPGVIIHRLQQTLDFGFQYR